MFGVTSEAGSVYPFGTPEITPLFGGVQPFAIYAVFCELVCLSTSCFCQDFVSLSGLVCFECPLDIFCLPFCHIL